MNRNSISDFRSWNLFQFLTALVLLLAAVFAVTLGVAEWAGESFFDLVSIWQVVGSIVLSAVLAFLYVQMRDIQGEQKDIMFQQQSPFVFIDQVSFSNRELFENIAENINESGLPLGVEDPEQYKFDNISVQLENQGNGVAVDMRIHSQITADLGNQKVQISSLQRPLTRNRSSGRVRLGNTEVSIMGNWNNHLEEGTSGEFNSPLLYTFESTDEDPVTIPFDCVTELLDGQDVEEARISFELVYEDSLGNSYSEDILEAAFSVEANMDLVDALAEGEREVPEEYKEEMHPGETASVSDFD
jgi:hypothetical protein